VDVSVVRGGRERLAQGGDQVAVEGVALLGPVEDDVADRAAVLALDDAHGRDHDGAGRDSLTSR
jgi:hypothetical protein